MRGIVVLVLICTYIQTAQAITQSLMKNLESLVRTWGCWEPLVPHRVNKSPALLPCPSPQQHFLVYWGNNFISLPLCLFNLLSTGTEVLDAQEQLATPPQHLLLCALQLWGVPWTVQESCKGNKINEFSSSLHYRRVLADLLKFRVTCYFLHETYF